MKRYSCIILLFLIVNCQLAVVNAQTTTETPLDFGLRVNVNVQKKIVSGLNVTIGEEIVTSDNVTEFSKFKTQVGLSYKPIPPLTRQE